MASCEMRYAALRERKVRKFLFHLLEIGMWPHGGDTYLHGAVHGLFVEAS
jgi:hypothetical protein